MKKKYTYRNYLSDKYLKRKFNKKHTHADTAPQRNRDAPFHIAFVIDGVVEDVIHCNERLGMLLLSDPIIVEIEDDKVSIDWFYDEETNTFTPPDEDDSIV